MSDNLYYVAFNTDSGEVLDVSTDPLSTEGAPVMVKPFMGELPDPLRYYWDKTSRSYQLKDQSRIMSHVDFRGLFTVQEEQLMDEFNDTYMTTQLPVELKRQIRTGLKRYSEASVINLDDPGVAEVLMLYTGMGILGPGRAEQVLANLLIKT